MRAMLFGTCWLNASNIVAYVDWVKHHMDRFSTDTVLYLFDDGSDECYLREFLQKCNVRSKLIFFNEATNRPYPEFTSCLWKANTRRALRLRERDGPIDLVVVSMQPHLGRGTGTYLGWWRSFLISYLVADTNNYDKILHIESDFYVISQKMVDHMKNLTSGWYTGWCKRYNFPEAAIQVICRDSIPVFGNFYRKYITNIDKLCGRCAEHKISDFSTPFKIRFIGDRLGEAETVKLSELMKRNLDYYGQLSRDPSIHS